MRFIKILFDKKSPFSFFSRFLLCFFVLSYFFSFYRGLTGEGGSFYIRFLDEHLNMVKGITGVLVVPAKFVLEMLNYHVVQNNYHTLRIEYARGISVNPSCLGWGVMSFWVSFIFANAGSLKRKAKWMLGGVAAIVALNITRIVLIVVANYRQWRTFTSLDHHAMFNIFSYGCIFLLIFWFTRLQKRYEGIHFAKPARHTLSAV